MLVAAIQPPCSVVAVVGVQRLAQLVKGDSACAQPRRVRCHLIAAHLAAEGVDVGHTRHGAQRWPDHPVQHAAPLGQGIAIALHREHEHLAQRRGDGRQAAHSRRRQIARQAGQTL